MPFKGEKKGQSQRREEKPRTIPQALTELSKLLNSGATSDVINPLVKQLEGMHASLNATFGAAVQHEADVANAMGNIRQALSDSRLEGLDIHSKLAYPPTQAKPSPQGHHR